MLKSNYTCQTKIEAPGPAYRQARRGFPAMYYHFILCPFTPPKGRGLRGTLRSLPFRVYKGTLPILFKGNTQFLLGVHNNRAIPGHWLANRFARY
jgi:hypothetical protein